MIFISITFDTQDNAPNANAKAIVFRAFFLVDGLMPAEKLLVEADQPTPTMAS